MRRVVLIFLLFSVALLPAQEVLKTSHDTVVHPPAPVKVTVINPHGKEKQNYTGKPVHVDSVQMALKVNPVLILHGDFPIYFEYRLSDAFSVEGAAGVTYVDYLYELFNNQARFLSTAAESKSVRFLSGFSGRLQFRYYPSRYETAISGFYIAPEISRRTYEMNYYVSNGLVSYSHLLKRNWNELRLQIGYQDADPYDNVFWEWFLSGGLRFANDDAVVGSGLDATFVHHDNCYGVVGGGVKLCFQM